MDDFIAKPTLKGYIYLDNIRVAGKDGKEHENPFNLSKAVFQNGQEFNKIKNNHQKSHQFHQLMWLDIPQYY